MILAIVSFRCIETEKIFKEKHSRKFGAIRRVAFRKPVMLHAAKALSDLAGIGNSLEALITADTSLRLGRYFSTTSEFWMNLQRDYDLRVAANASRARIERDVQPRRAA